MQKLILQYINKHLYSHLCRYRKGYSTENAVISILEKWKLFTDKKGFAGGVLIDLSKAFDKINHYYKQNYILMDSADKIWLKYDAIYKTKNKE